MGNRVGHALRGRWLKNRVGVMASIGDPMIGIDPFDQG